MTAEQEMMTKLDKLHTTPLGAERIGRNISVNADDTAAFCKKLITGDCTVIKRCEKNIYAENGNIVITSTQEA